MLSNTLVPDMFFYVTKKLPLLQRESKGNFFD